MPLKEVCEFVTEGEFHLRMNHLFHSSLGCRRQLASGIDVEVHRLGAVDDAERHEERSRRVFPGDPHRLTIETYAHVEIEVLEPSDTRTTSPANEWPLRALVSLPRINPDG